MKLQRRQFLHLAVGAAALPTVSRIAWAQNPVGAEARLKELNITLPPPPTVVANYVGAVRTGNLLFLAGSTQGVEGLKGKLGREVTVEQGYQSSSVDRIEAALRCPSRSDFRGIGRCNRVPSWSAGSGTNVGDISGKFRPNVGTPPNPCDPICVRDAWEGVRHPSENPGTATRSRRANEGGPDVESLTR